MDSGQRTVAIEKFCSSPDAKLMLISIQAGYGAVVYGWVVARVYACVHARLDASRVRYVWVVPCMCLTRQ